MAAPIWRRLLLPLLLLLLLHETRGYLGNTAARNGLAVVALRPNGSVAAWGNQNNGGNTASVASQLTSDVAAVYSSCCSFAAIMANGSAVVWGNSNTGGDASSVASNLTSGIVSISSTEGAFAALREGGSVVTWGGPYGGTSSGVASDLASGVVAVYSNPFAFAALLSNGSVVTWGDPPYGGDSSNVASQLSGVVDIFANGYCFAALRNDGSVVMWGERGSGGNAGSTPTNPYDVRSQLTSGVVSVYGTPFAFCALKNDGSVVCWGHQLYGGTPAATSKNPNDVRSNLTSGVVGLASNDRAFAAWKNTGEVVTWGDSDWGGDTSSIAASLASGVISISSTDKAFAGLKVDGSVTCWGAPFSGGDCSSLASQLASGVVRIASNSASFVALKDDGSIVCWGDAGGDCASVASSMSSSVVSISSAGRGYAALLADGSVVSWGDLGPAPGSLGVVSSLFGSRTEESAQYYTAAMPYRLLPGSNQQQVFLRSNGQQSLASITFASVSSGGATTVTPLVPSSPSYVELPAGLQSLPTPAYYDITTTATYTGPVDVCLTYLTSTPPSLLHYVGGAWQNVTAATNTTTGTVCGQVSSLSPFALVEPQTPSASPSIAPTGSPSTRPSASPSLAPSALPTASPSRSPTPTPTAGPTGSPTLSPTSFPTFTPPLPGSRIQKVAVDHVCTPEVVARRRELHNDQDHQERGLQTTWTPESCYATCQARLGGQPTFLMNIYNDNSTGTQVCTCCRSCQGWQYVPGAQLFAACAVTPGANSLVQFKATAKPRKLGAGSGKRVKYRAHLKNTHASVALQGLALSVQLPVAGVTYRKSKVAGGGKGLVAAVNTTATPQTVTWRNIVLPPRKGLRFTVKVRTNGMQWGQGRTALVFRGAVFQELPANGLSYCGSGYVNQTVAKANAWGTQKQSGSWGTPKRTM